MAIKIFFCYAHEDERLLIALKIHLRPLQREGLIDIWYDRDISAGEEWEKEIENHLNAAKIILLLVSPDFMNSDYCYGFEMKRAIERHERKEARVIPIILRPVFWQVEPLSKLQALPTDAKPVISSYWYSQDEAFFDITQSIHKLVLDVLEKPLIEVPFFSLGDHFSALSQPYFSTQTAEYSSKAQMDAQERACCAYVAQKATQRQLDVLRCFADGLFTQEIANKLMISTKTVYSHKTVLLDLCKETWDIADNASLDHQFLYKHFSRYFEGSRI